MVDIAYTFGWRMQSEVLTLERRQLDLDAGTIRLDPGTTKNDDGSLVYLPAALKAQLAAQVDRVRTLERRLERIVPSLFPHPAGRRQGERVGDFVTWNVGAGARVVWRGFSVGVATHFTGADANISSPWGSWPGYLSLQVTDFDRANEKAFGMGLGYDFAGTLLPFQLPGLSVKAIYGQGNDRINPTTGAGQPTTREGDLDIIYNIAAIKGLSLRFRNAYVDRGNPQVLKEFRLIVNYDLNLL